MEDRIRRLAASRDAVWASVKALQERITISTLEEKVEELEGQVNRLLSEKKELVKRIASFNPG